MFEIEFGLENFKIEQQNMKNVLKNKLPNFHKN